MKGTCEPIRHVNALAVWYNIVLLINDRINMQNQQDQTNSRCKGVVSGLTMGVIISGASMIFLLLFGKFIRSEIKLDSKEFFILMGAVSSAILLTSAAYGYRNTNECNIFYRYTYPNESSPPVTREENAHLTGSLNA